MRIRFARRLTAGLLLAVLLPLGAGQPVRAADDGSEPVYIDEGEGGAADGALPGMFGRSSRRRPPPPPPDGGGIDWRNYDPNTGWHRPPGPPPPRPPYPPNPYDPNPYNPYDNSFAHAKEINISGIRAYNRGDYHEAMRLYNVAKDMGYPAAYTNIGVCYQNGLGVRRDYLEAAKWYYEAQMRGHETGRRYLDNLIRAGLVPPPPGYYPGPTPTPVPAYSAGRAGVGGMVGFGAALPPGAAGADGAAAAGTEVEAVGVQEE